MASRETGLTDTTSPLTRTSTAKPVAISSDGQRQSGGSPQTLSNAAQSSIRSPFWALNQTDQTRPVLLLPLPPSTALGRCSARVVCVSDADRWPGVVVPRLRAASRYGSRKRCFSRVSRMSLVAQLRAESSYRLPSASSFRDFQGSDAPWVQYTSIPPHSAAPCADVLAPKPGGPHLHLLLLWPTETYNMGKKD